ncbi:DUF58 domain-containing protein [Actinoplanes sp. CA-142083]|uniref:DUF58 domain-containing protein n=1 Tax=Actinoplanes sp. CA-142083 TaxID=3239903 RepID=UPI003D921E34
MTPNGAILGAGGLIALTGGAGLGYPAGYAVAAVCLALLVLGLPFPPLPGRSVRLELTVEPRTVVRGDSVTVSIAANARAVAQLRVGEQFAELAVGGREPARWTSPALPRGRLIVEVERVVAVGPLGLWRWIMSSTGGRAEITVFPRHVELAEPPEVIDPEEDNRPARIGVGAGAALAGLREYEAGDDLRHVDWAASARSSDGALYVRHFTAALAEEHVVVLDPRGPDRREEFEVAVDLAYSFLLAGIEVALDGETEPVGREELIGLTPRTGPPAARRTGGVVAVITAEPDAEEELRTTYGSQVLILGVGGSGALADAAAAWAGWTGR